MLAFAKEFDGLVAGDHRAPGGHFSRHLLSSKHLTVCQHFENCVSAGRYTVSPSLSATFLFRMGTSQSRHLLIVRGVLHVALAGVLAEKVKDSFLLI